MRRKSSFRRIVGDAVNTRSNVTISRVVITPREKELKELVARRPLDRELVERHIRLLPPEDRRQQFFRDLITAFPPITCSENSLRARRAREQEPQHLGTVSERPLPDPPNLANVDLAARYVWALREAWYWGEIEGEWAFAESLKDSPFLR